MSRQIRIDAATADLLSRTREPAVLLDEAGRLVGFYSPPHAGGIAPQVPNFAEEDLRRWESEPGGRTLREIMSDLEKLP
jgi:hypothetical protein